MNPEMLKARTKEFAKAVIDICRRIPDTKEGRKIDDQLFRSGTSVGANYRSACRGRSKAEFVAKLGIALEEVDEAQYWLEIVEEKDVLDSEYTKPLIREAEELIRIFVASLNTAKADLEKSGKK